MAGILGEVAGLRRRHLAGIGFGDLRAALAAELEPGLAPGVEHQARAVEPDAGFRRGAAVLDAELRERGEQRRLVGFVGGQPRRRHLQLADPHLARRGAGGLLERRRGTAIVTGPVCGAAERRLGVEGQPWPVRRHAASADRRRSRPEPLRRIAGPVARPAQSDGGDAEADGKAPPELTAGRRRAVRVADWWKCINSCLWWCGRAPADSERGATSQGNEASNLTTSD